MNDTLTETITRDSVLKQLSDAEIASVSTAETADRLLDGEEYLDLQQLGRGVQRAVGADANMGRVLPKKAIHEATWSRVLSIVERDSRSGAATPSVTK
jgi:hypothetical protein